MAGLGRRTQQEHSSAPRLLASSPEAMQGGEQRGASFAQQSAPRGASFASQSEPRGASPAPQSRGAQNDESSSNLFYKRLPIMVSDSVIMSTSEDREAVFPSTSVRKNITTRRSRGRLDEPRNPREVTMKRSKGRSRDRAYRRESMGSLPTAGASHRNSTLPSPRMKVGGSPLPGPEMLRRCKARIVAEMEHRTQARIQSLRSQAPAHVRPLGEASRVSREEVSRVSQTPVPAPMRVAFLKRDIPSITEHPQAHAEIMDLLCIRHQYQEDMVEALVDGDDIRHDEAQLLNWSAMNACIQ